MSGSQSWSTAVKRITILIGLVWLLLASSARGDSAASLAWIVDGYSVASQPPGNRSCDNAVHNTGPDVVKPLVRRGPMRRLLRTTWGRPYRAQGGYEFAWLQPRFTENVAVVASWPSGNDAVAFDHAFENTSRVWAAIENSRCTGLRARFWELRMDAPRLVTFANTAPLSLTIQGGSGNLSRTAVANVGEVMTSDHRLEMRTIDLEGTQRHHFTRTETLASFGLRYVKTHQRAHAVATDGTGSLTELVCQDLDFHGFGPTAAVDVKRALFCGDSWLGELSFFADARGSILFGKQEQEIVLVTGGGAGLAEDRYQNDDFLPIAELAGGLQWQMRPLGRALWTLRTGYRAESWFTAGGPVDSDSSIGVHGVTLAIAARW